MLGTPISFSISSGFVSGTNTLDFVVSNAGGGPTGLIVSLLPVYGTGQNVANGRDNSFQIISDTTGEVNAPAQALVVNSPGWGTNVPGAAWIAPSADQSSDRNVCCFNGVDDYRTTFTVPGSAAAMTLNLTLSADDYVDVLLNGKQVFTHPNTSMWNASVSFSITSGFVTGTNTLDFVVSNAGGGPTGLIVAMH
jgi:hypothetical protein